MRGTHSVAVTATVAVAYCHTMPPMRRYVRTPRYAARVATYARYATDARAYTPTALRRVT